MKKFSHSMTQNETLLGLVYISVKTLVLPSLTDQLNLFLGELSPVQFNFVLFCLDFICVSVIFHRFLLQGLKQVMNAPVSFLRYTGLAFACYLLGNFVVNTVIYTVYPEYSNVNDTSIAQLTQQNFLLMSVGTVLLVPVAEETLYRGVVFGNLYKRNRVAGFLLSTIIFAALHVVGYIGIYETKHLLLCFIQYFPAGLCLAWAYGMTDTIWAPILMHIINNLISILAMR